MFNQTHFVQKFLNSSFNWIILLLFFLHALFHFFIIFKHFYSTLHIYMLILLPFLYLLENDQRSVETSFLSVIFTVLNLLRDDFLNVVPCIKKIFLPSVSNKVLINHVIRTPKVTSADVCGLRCYFEINCESYNFGANESGNHVCELSDSDAIRQPMEWITKQGFIYSQVLNTALRVVRAPLGNTNIS